MRTQMNYDKARDIAIRSRRLRAREYKESITPWWAYRGKHKPRRHFTALISEAEVAYSSLSKVENDHTDRKI